MHEYMLLTIHLEWKLDWRYRQYLRGNNAHKRFILKEIKKDGKRTHSRDKLSNLSNGDLYHLRLRTSVLTVKNFSKLIRLYANI